MPAALFVAAAGTALHRQQLRADRRRPSLGCRGSRWSCSARSSCCLGAAFRSVIPTAACGVLCYVLAGWWSTLEPGKRLIVGDFPGYIWVFGIAGVTVLMLVWCRRYRGAQAAGLTTRAPKATARCAGRRGGAGGTSFAATTRSRGITTSACRVRTVQSPASVSTRWPSASVRPAGDPVADHHPGPRRGACQKLWGRRTGWVHHFILGAGSMTRGMYDAPLGSQERAGR